MHRQPESYIFWGGLALTQAAITFLAITALRGRWTQCAAG
jgi:hypothetical protein